MCTCVLVLLKLKSSGEDLKLHVREVLIILQMRDSVICTCGLDVDYFHNQKKKKKKGRNNTAWNMILNK